MLVFPRALPHHPMQYLIGYLLVWAHSGCVESERQSALAQGLLERFW